MAIAKISLHYILQLFSVTAKIKEKKITRGFSSRGKTTSKLNLAVSSNLLQWPYGR